MNGEQDRLPALLGGVYGATDIASRGVAARKEIPALLQESSKAKEEAEISKFQAEQGVQKRVAGVEKGIAEKSRAAAGELEAGIKPYQEFVQPEYKASDYAANAAARLFTGLMVGGIAKTSAIGQLKAVRDMQKAEDQGLREEFAAAKIRFDEGEKARKDFNDNLKQRFDRMMKLLSTDRNAALAEAKIIESSLGEGAIRANIRAGNLQKAADQFNKFSDTADKLYIAKEQTKAKTESAIEVALARAAAKGDKPEKPITLPSGIDKKLENIGSTRVSMARMSQSAKPQYFGVAPSDAIANAVIDGVEKGLPVGELVNSVIKTAPKVNAETVAWWKDYQEYVSKVRNLLFGATLTGREAQDFRKFTISPATDPAIAMDYLNKQMQIVNNAVARERKKATALKVPADVIDAYIELPEESRAPKSFKSVDELDAAAARGEVKKGDKVTVGGQTGTYQ
jgi:hypothetical protein